MSDFIFYSLSGVPSVSFPYISKIPPVIAGEEIFEFLLENGGHLDPKHLTRSFENHIYRASNLRFSCVLRSCSASSATGFIISSSAFTDPKKSHLWYSLLVQLFQWYHAAGCIGTRHLWWKMSRVKHQKKTDLQSTTWAKKNLVV